MQVNRGLVAGVLIAGSLVFVGAEILAAQIDHAHRPLPVAIAIALFCGLIVWLAHFETFLRRNRIVGATFAVASLFILVSTSVAYFGVLAGVDFADYDYPRTVDQTTDKLDELILIDRNRRYFLDGGIDEWAFVLYKQGLFGIEYGRIFVQEKGTVYLYAGLLRLAGDFNTYLLVIAHSAAKVLSAWLLFSIARRFMSNRAAAGAAGLLLVMPETVLWSAVLHKDNLSVTLLLLCFFSFLNSYLPRSVSWVWCGVFLMSLFGLAFIRSGLIVPLVFAGALSIALLRTCWLERITRYAIALIAGVVLFAAVMPAPVAVHVRGNALDRIYHKLAGGSSYRLDAQNITFRGKQEDSLVYRVGGGDLSWKTLHFVPIRIAMYLIAPFPALPSSATQERYTVPTSWIFIFLSFFFLRGTWSAVRERDADLLCFLCFFIATSLAVAFAGGFVYERYRSLLAPFYFVLASLGEGKSTYRQKWLLVLASTVAYLFALQLYWSLK
jgi:hypothetical protein